MRVDVLETGAVLRALRNNGPADSHDERKMATLQELLDQQAALNRQITELRSSDRARAIADVRALMAEHGLTAADLVSASAPRKAAAKTSGRKVAAKYRNPTTGATWSGRGLKPKWLAAALAAGQALSDFAV